MTAEKQIKLLTAPLPKFTFAEAALAFANLESAGELGPIIEILVRTEMAGPEINVISSNDTQAFAGLVDLHGDVREWLVDLIRGSKAKREAVLQELIRQIPNASPPIKMPEGDSRPLPFIPEIVFNDGKLKVLHHWQVRGLHAVVVLGIVQIIIDGLLGKLRRCECGKFYLAKPELRAACSLECYQEQRRELAREGMRELRRPRKRKSRKRGR